MVVATTVLGIAAGVVVVAQLAQSPGSKAAASEAVAAESAAETAPEPAKAPVASTTPPPPETPRDRWPVIGVVLPSAIFLTATWITAALHRRFSTGQG